MPPVLYVLLFFNILFNFGGFEGRETWCTAIPSACYMARPSLQQQEWGRENEFGEVIVATTLVDMY